MRRPLVLKALSAALPFAALLALGALGALGALAACGGNDKPPLTPDNLEPSVENADGGTPGTPAPTK